MNKKVLYIEDNAHNRQLIERALNGRGYTLFFAMNGQDGLRIAQSERPDLILLDINLPDIDGYEVARRLRNSGDRFLHQVPIIAITANALKGDAERALTAGCDIYMSKPINLRELWARVEAFVPVAA